MYQNIYSGFLRMVGDRSNFLIDLVLTYSLLPPPVISTSISSLNATFSLQASSLRFFFSLAHFFCSPLLAWFIFQVSAYMLLPTRSLPRHSNPPPYIWNRFPSHVPPLHSSLYLNRALNWHSVHPPFWHRRDYCRNCLFIVSISTGP